MDIINYTQGFELTPDQKRAVSLLEAFMQNDEHVFILKGYAGTGKTTLIKGMVAYFNEVKRKFDVMAPTGRAAKVLRLRTDAGSTIHRAIYNFEKLETIEDESVDDANKSFKYYFPLRNETDINRIMIVDEASMISSNYNEHELFRFGSGFLLRDLIKYADYCRNGNKIIFVGDPAQLPPVGDNKSSALDPAFFQSLGLQVNSFEMRQVTRQKADSLILKNATTIRDILQQEKRTSFILEHDNVECQPIQVQDVAHTYLNLYPLPEVGDGVIISYSNAQAYEYNKSIRQILYPDNPQVNPGDILLLNNNNYHTYGAELFNGDMVKVLEVNPLTEVQSAPVMVNNVRKVISLTFRNARFYHPDLGCEIQCKIIDSLLHSPERDLSIHEMKALYINFVMRFQEEQNRRKAKGLSTFKVGSIQFKDMLRVDPYFNALRVKFGYAITCHKAQGSEWQKVFVDFHGRIGLKNDQLRWSYTAITRAAEKLLTINAPTITPLDKLKFSAIGRIGKFPPNALKFADIPATPYHTIHAHPAKRQMYFEIVSKIAPTPYELIRVDSKDYLEMYFFKRDHEQIRVDLIHDLGGFFTKIVSANQNASDLIELIKQPVKFQQTIDYNPSSDSLKHLWNQVQIVCDETNIAITNVIEELQKNFVTYFLKTTGVCAYVQFYFTKDGRFSTAIPKSDLGDQDELLLEFIQKMKEYEL
ncbi:MAG: AAA family ATPase [Prolixibacteraceae bacterium]|nr:AAA family ATPase [Prolixibacteraceae bacterium]